jgi:hypothetical protein
LFGCFNCFNCLHVACSVYCPLCVFHCCALRVACRVLRIILASAASVPCVCYCAVRVMCVASNLYFA